MSQTTLLLGGRIHSPTYPDATAMAVVDGTVAWVGSDRVGQALHPDAEQVPLDGAFVAPAFVDAHVHTTAAGLALEGLDLTGCASVTELLHAVREHIAEHPDTLVWGHGWDESTWPEQRPPRREELDTAAGDTPVYLSRIDAHSALASTALLRRAPEAEHSDGFNPQGPLTRAAHHHVRAAARAGVPAEQRRHAQRSFLHHAAAHGVAAVHECAGPDISGLEDFTELLALRGQPGIPDITGYWGERGALATAADTGAAGLAGDLFVDGALGSHTAALHAPYTDAPDTRGTVYLDADGVADHLITCTRHRIRAGFHVIGDAAVSTVVDGFHRAAADVGAPALAAARHRLEHLEMVTAEQAEQLGQYGVVASVQPAFDAAWGGRHGLYARRLGPQRGSALNPLSTLARHGVVLALGSDCPVTPCAPWQAVRAAVHHRTDGAGISPRAAFAAHTRGGWRAAGVDDGLTGTLVPGAPATYAVWHTGELAVGTPDERVQRWSTDPRAGVPPLPRLDEEAALPTCLRTVLRGVTLYDRANQDHAVPVHEEGGL